MRKARSQDLLFVSKANKEKLDALAAGVSLVHRSGYEIRELKAKTTLDRLTLAQGMLLSAQFAFRVKQNRVTVSRAYYSMYHALRAATFYVFGGDDHEKHADLPSKLPVDFPDRAKWENALKTARLERNRADYDPYPKIDEKFRPTAKATMGDAKSLMPTVKEYLKKKGCSL